MIIKKLIFLISILFIQFSIVNAVETDELIEVHSLTSSEIVALNAPIEEGKIVFNSETKKLLVYSNNIWKELLFNTNVYVKSANYTLTLSDNTSVIAFDSTSDVTLTIPSGLPVGYNVSIYQTNSGKVTVQGVAGVSVLNRLNRFRTAGKDAGIGIVSTSSNVFHVTGDLRR